jgi:WD40 repeat protein
MQMAANQGKRENYEVSKILYLEEEKLLISGSCDSVIRVYEADQEQENQLLRELKDGHKDSEVTALEYSSEYMRLVSGSSNGIVSVWDFENNKAEAIFREHQTDVQC